MFGGGDSLGRVRWGIGYGNKVFKIGKGMLLKERR